METTDYSQIHEELLRRAMKYVWCSVATVDRTGRPRNRVLHPIWEGPVGWVMTFPKSHKAKHLAKVPFVSCGYVDAIEPMYIDAAVSWETEDRTKQRVWEHIRSVPEPYGFDPATTWKDGPGGDDFGLLRLDPWRIELYTSRPPGLPDVTVWRPA
jgi:hypothetical protein